MTDRQTDGTSQCAKMKMYQHYGIKGYTQRTNGKSARYNKSNKIIKRHAYR